jgi:N-acetyltransferase
MFFDTKEDVILENNKVVMLPLQMEHYHNILPITIAEPTLWQYSFMQPNSEPALQQYLQSAIAARENGTAYAFAIFSKPTGEFIGSTRYYDIQLNQKSTQLGYTWYSKKYWDAGINKNCKYLMLQFAFERLGFNRVEFRADNNNARSIAAMKSIGCTVEGILQSNGVKPDGTRRDSIVLSILKQEWEQRVKLGLEVKL